MIAALQHGLVSDAELRSLLHLIRSPDVCIAPGVNVVIDIC
jgi:hypothetical protein